MCFCLPAGPDEKSSTGPKKPVKPITLELPFNLNHRLFGSSKRPRVFVGTQSGGVGEIAGGVTGGATGAASQP
ncbi:hypothetical protein MRS44_000803 [Fusarium solani]|uniref:uncharacterized protein n=1 Tax=Fusarium solani TaxID=169388 RepID=UPI0032C43B7A|nr:hypothetical protein MRS44_000803 [Fusarium solani]